MSPADENNHPGEIEITNDLTIPKLFLKSAEKIGEQREAMRGRSSAESIEDLILV